MVFFATPDRAQQEQPIGGLGLCVRARVRSVWRVGVQGTIKSAISECLRFALASARDGDDIRVKLDLRMGFVKAQADDANQTKDVVGAMRKITRLFRLFRVRELAGWGCSSSEPHLPLLCFFLFVGARSGLLVSRSLRFTRVS